MLIPSKKLYYVVQQYVPMKALVNVRIFIRNFVLRILKHAKSQFLET